MPTYLPTMRPCKFSYSGFALRTHVVLYPNILDGRGNISRERMLNLLRCLDIFLVINLAYKTRNHNIFIVTTTQRKKKNDWRKWREQDPTFIYLGIFSTKLWIFYKKKKSNFFFQNQNQDRGSVPGSNP